MKFLGKVFLHDILNGILAVSAASPHGMGARNNYGALGFSFY